MEAKPSSSATSGAIWGLSMKRILCTGAGGPAGINFVKSLQVAPEKMFIVGTESNEY